MQVGQSIGGGGACEDSQPGIVGPSITVGFIMGHSIGPSMLSCAVLEPPQVLTMRTLCRRRGSGHCVFGSTLTGLWCGTCVADTGGPVSLHSVGRALEQWLCGLSATTGP